MDNKINKLINLIFKENLPTVNEIYNKYSYRNLKNEQKITRIAPSPTGYIHIGTVYMALICETIAHQSKGIFFLRIEDTDEKREVIGIAEKIPAYLKKYNILFDEGYNDDGKNLGIYGPYKQSERKNIYKVFIKELLQNDQAYPCFCSEEELDNIIIQQKAQNCQRLGYYGNWAKYRNFPIEESIKKIENGEKYVIRFKSPGNFNKKIAINDSLKGIVEFPENDLDIVILKKNDLPTYHFAHVVDDHLMGTNLVLRGDEWLPSLPLHIQLFQSLKWKAPQYAHISPILKLDGNGKRKLSKRKDPEANIDYFEELGYPKESLMEYLLNLANSNFEDWRKQNPTKHYKEFQLSLKKMNTSGALFDFVKLSSISRDLIGKMSAEDIYNQVIVWSEKFNSNLFDLFKNHKMKILEILNIERDDPKKIRKDIVKWNEIEEEIKYFFSIEENNIKDSLQNVNLDNIKEITKFFIENYNDKDSNEEWFNKVKIITEQLNYAVNMKDFKTNPQNYKGSIADIANILRIIITGKKQSPNLYYIMKILGKNECIKRLLIKL